ncbi:hypothetical protein ES703_02128 [subsurface metagenome]
MAKIPVLMLVDQYGWSFDFVSRGLRKYSTKFDCRTKRWNEVDQYDRRFHYVLAFNCSVWGACGVRRSWLNAPQTKFYIGIPRDIIDVRLHVFLKKLSGVACNNLVALKKLKKKYPKSHKLFYTPNGVDTAVFKPYVTLDRLSIGKEDRFVVGWSGTVEWDVKRVHLTKKLKYPVKIKCNRFGNYFKRGVSQRPMIDFYRSIDCFIHTSTSEGLPNVILEAAASGLPIISTPVGDIPRLVEKKWLVPLNPERLVIKEMNKRLSLLRNNAELRRRVGARNRQEVVKNWSWTKQVQNYEKMFLSSPT